ncbi:MAG: CHAT domain-containing protein [Desulfobacteraceae bacterium]|jgi:hypothetical protein
MKYDLLITCIDIPKTKENEIDTTRQRGIDLLYKIKDLNLQLPSILLSDHFSSDLVSLVQKFHRCAFVEVREESLINDILYECRKLLPPQLVSSRREYRPKSGNLHVYFRSGMPCQYRMDGAFNHPLTPLSFQSNRIPELEILSRTIGKLGNNDWEPIYRIIGVNLLRELFEQNPKFDSTFSTFREVSGGNENIKIHFEVDESVYAIALESLVDQNENYFRLQSPIYRTVPFSCIKPPLFKDEETREQKINCLIIEADAEGFVAGMERQNGEPLELEKLHNIKQEREYLHRFLKEGRKTFNIDIVNSLVIPKVGSNCIEVLNNVIDNGPWHLVHFAGHSHYDYSNDKAFVFFPGRTTPFPLEAEDFAQMLRTSDTRFIYLSSCRSSESRFVFELAKQGIPAILGFRWDIEDELALDHAKFFYKKLFREGRWLEYAFLKTINYVRPQNTYSRIWAGSMLVMQATT